LKGTSKKSQSEWSFTDPAENQDEVQKKILFIGGGMRTKIILEAVIRPAGGRSVNTAWEREDVEDDNQSQKLKKGKTFNTNSGEGKNPDQGKGETSGSRKDRTTTWKRENENTRGNRLFCGENKNEQPEDRRDEKAILKRTVE